MRVVRRKTTYSYTRFVCSSCVCCTSYNIGCVCGASGRSVVCFHLLLVGRWCFPAFSALVGRVGRWRSSGCAVRARNRQFALYKRFRRLFGLWAVALPLAPVSRLLRFICVLTAFCRFVGIFTTCHI